MVKLSADQYRLKQGTTGHRDLDVHELRNGILTAGKLRAKYVALCMIMFICMKAIL